jgi:hypothetical protein
MGSTQSSNELKTNDNYPPYYCEWRRDLIKAWENTLLTRCKEPKWERWYSRLEESYKRWKREFELESKENSINTHSMNNIKMVIDNMSYLDNNEKSVEILEKLLEINRETLEKLKLIKDEYEREDEKWKQCLKQAKTDWDNEIIFTYTKKLI